MARANAKLVLTPGNARYGDEPFFYVGRVDGHSIMFYMKGCGRGTGPGTIPRDVKLAVDKKPNHLLDAKTRRLLNRFPVLIINGPVLGENHYGTLEQIEESAPIVGARAGLPNLGDAVKQAISHWRRAQKTPKS
jgi:hypothetical protein